MDLSCFRIYGIEVIYSLRARDNTVTSDYIELVLVQTGKDKSNYIASIEIRSEEVL